LDDLSMSEPLPPLNVDIRSSVLTRKPPFPDGDMFYIVFLFHAFDGLGLAAGEL
jgi:hypothetical protein